MKNIGEHIRMLEELKAEKNHQQQQALADRHRDLIDTKYDALRADLEAVLEKHASACLACDVTIDTELAQEEGRPPLSTELIFSLVTGRVMVTAAARAAASWAVKRSLAIGAPVVTPGTDDSV